jgi:hypothetical protein
MSRSFCRRLFVNKRTHNIFPVLKKGNYLLIILAACASSSLSPSIVTHTVHFEKRMIIRGHFEISVRHEDLLASFYVATLSSPHTYWQLKDGTRMQLSNRINCYVEFCLLGYNVVWPVEVEPKIRWDMSLPPSESKNKPSNGPAAKQLLTAFFFGWKTLSLEIISSPLVIRNAHCPHIQAKHTGTRTESCLRNVVCNK